MTRAPWETLYFVNSKEQHTFLAVYTCFWRMAAVVFLVMEIINSIGSTVTLVETQLNFPSLTFPFLQSSGSPYQRRNFLFRANWKPLSRCFARRRAAQAGETTVCLSHFLCCTLPQTAQTDTPEHTAQWRDIDSCLLLNLPLTSTSTYAEDVWSISCSIKSDCSCPGYMCQTCSRLVNRCNFNAIMDQLFYQT